MHKTCSCKCGSKRVVYVIQKGRGRKLEAFCEKCLPVEALDEKTPEKKEKKSLKE